jgi:hypothetical protein
MAFVYYQKDSYGRWGFHLSAERPETRTAEGVRRPISQVTELPPEHVKLTFNQLREIYPLISMSQMIPR